MLPVRREFCADSDFIKLPEVWEELCGVSDEWSIKTYRSNEQDDLKLKAGLVVFENRVILTADERLLANAKRGCSFSNFILAHELGHLALNHHARGAVTKNFQLAVGKYGNSIQPPDSEEMSANYAAVFFQCGPSLTDPRWSAKELAKRAYSDVGYVKKAQRIVRLDVFQREVNRAKPKHERLVL